MQTSGTAPQFSDGVRKTVVGKAPNPFRPVPRAPKAAPAAKPAVHRGGGHAKHARRGK